VTEDGAFAITTGRPALSKLAAFETGEVVSFGAAQRGFRTAWSG
jgi:hypothetical protein